MIIKNAIALHIFPCRNEVGIVPDGDLYRVAFGYHETDTVEYGLKMKLEKARHFMWEDIKRVWDNY